MSNVNANKTKFPIGASRERLQMYLEHTDYGDLDTDSSGQTFDTTTNFDTRWILLRIMLVYDAVCTSTLVLTFKSRNGATFDTPLATIDLSDYSDTTEIVIAGEEIDIYNKGDELNVNILGGSDEPNVNLTLIGKEIP